MLIKTTQKADRILSNIKKIDKANSASLKEKTKIYVFPYHNGREKGWQLINDNKAVTFSEYRKTDQIVVYCGSTIDFENAIPSEEIYSAKTFFAHDEYNKAANFCMKYLFS